MIESFKDPNLEYSIPDIWKPTISHIIEIICNYSMQRVTEKYEFISLSHDTLRDIYNNIESYGGHVISLTDEAWSTSICRWMGDHWKILIDIPTNRENPSDLVLFILVRERQNSFLFEVESMHVP